MISRELYDRYYADPKYDLTTRFFCKIKERASPDAMILAVGAGGGNGDDRCSLKGYGREVVGTDIDPEVVSNPQVDRGIVNDGINLPFDDNSFDLAFSDYVVEHVEHPRLFLKEIARVLKPDAPYFIRTPNIFHYVTLGSMLTKHSFHTRFANKMRGLPQDTHEPWPTFYRLNTITAIKRVALEAGFSDTALEMTEGHPSYLMFHTVPFYLGLAYERLVNASPRLAGIRGNIVGCLIK